VTSRGLEVGRRDRRRGIITGMLLATGSEDGATTLKHEINDVKQRSCPRRRR